MRKYFRSLMCLLGAGMLLLSGCGNGSDQEAAKKKVPEKEYDIFVYNGDSSIGTAFRKMCDEYTKRTGVIIRTVTPSEEENTVENLDSYVNSEYPPDIFTVSSIDELKKWQMTENIWDFSNATEENFKKVVNAIPENLRLSSNTSNSFGIPTTLQGYGFIVDPKMIASLFGGDKYMKVLNDLQECSYAEFEDFVREVSSYISSGFASDVTLNGKTYSFSGKRGELSEKLRGVFSFAAPDSKMVGSYLINPVLASIFYSPAEAYIADDMLLESLRSPLMRYAELLDLMSSYTAGSSGVLSRGSDFVSTAKNGATPSIKNFIAGKSVFLFGSTKDYQNISIFDLSVAKRCVFIPLKVPVTQYDVTSSGKTINKNLNKSITLDIPRYYCINASSSEKEKKAAQDFLVWLKTSDLAQKYVVSEFGYVPYDIQDVNVFDNPLERSMINYISEGKFLSCVYKGAPETWCESEVGKKVVSSFFKKQSWTVSDYDDLSNYAVSKWKELKADEN